jgi:hypothetical protein
MNLLAEALDQINRDYLPADALAGRFMGFNKCLVLAVNPDLEKLKFEVRKF